MEMEQEKKNNLQEKLRLELQEIGNQPISDSEAFEAYFNLSGFLKVLNKMKKEAQNGQV